jgi:hypothetical protein
MKRRDFIVAAAAFGAVPSALRAEIAPASELGRPWNVPRGRTVELWPAQVGLGIADALDAVAGWQIPSNARLVLRLEDGVHAQSRAIDLVHPDGIRLCIIGNVRQPEKCVLTWKGASEGFYAGAGALLGMLDGVQIEHVAPSQRGQGSGVLAELGGMIRCGRNVAVRNFYYGFQARIGGIIACAGTSSSGAGDANYFAYNGGHLFAQEARASRAIDAANALGFGFVAEFGGTIDATAGEASLNHVAGFAAMTNGAIRAHRAIARQNGTAGFYAINGGVIEAYAATGRGNCGKSRLLRASPDGISSDHFVDEGNDAPAQNCTIDAAQTARGGEHG